MKKIAISLMCIFTVCIATVSAQFKMSEATMKVATTMAIIENLYVDKVDDAKLSEDVVKAILEKLDPHSTYISAKEANEMNEPLEGNFDGIGISFNMMTDTVYVLETIAGGPSEKVGLRPGDKIIMVNDTLIAGIKMPTNDVMSLLKGPKGTTVNIKVLRKGESQLIDFKIVRAKIPIHSIDATYMVNKEVGYIRLSRFGATTTKEFRDALKKLKGEGMKNLILDLEHNGGGYLSAAIEIADDFLDKDKLIVYTEGAKHPQKEEKANGKGVFEEGKLVILINESSASASEIVAGAVQDWDRGVIVGRRSFGKGLVQRQFPLPDKSLIRLTVARYYTPTGRSIQRPYTNGDRETYEKDVIARYNSGEMISADSIHFPDSLKYQTMLNKRTVYGSGGIMPDYYVAIDTAAYPMYYRMMRAGGLTLKIAYNEVDNNREMILKKFPDAMSFYKNYTVSDEVLKKLIDAGEEGNIKLVESPKNNNIAPAVNDSINKRVFEYSVKEYDIAKPLFVTEIKALMARDLYDTNIQFRILNEQNDVYKKGYEIINDDKLYRSLLKQPK